MTGTSRILVTNGPTRVDTDELLAASGRLDAIAADLEEVEYRARLAGQDALAGPGGDFEGGWRALLAAEAAEHAIALARDRLNDLVDSLRFAAALYAQAETEALSLAGPLALTAGGFGARALAGGLAASPGPSRNGGILLALLLSEKGPLGPGADSPARRILGRWGEWLARLVATGSTTQLRSEIAEFITGRGDGMAGRRLQGDIEAISRTLVDTPFSEERPGAVPATRRAAVGASRISSLLGGIVFGAPEGVEVSTGEGLARGRGRALVDPAGGVNGDVARIGEAGMRGVEVAAAIGILPAAAGRAADFIRHPLPAPGSALPAPAPASRAATPGEPAALLDALESIDGSGESGQLMILRHETPLDDGTSTRSWSVVIRGTQKWGVGGSNPQDMLSNFQGVAGLDTDQNRAVLAAMDMAGIATGEPVEFVGHSQGGIIAAELATDRAVCHDYTVVSVLTAGSPIAGSAPHDGVRILALENTRDIVPGLDGADNAPGVVTVHFDGRDYAPEGKEAKPLVAHDIGLYRNALADLHASAEPELAEVAAWEEARESRLGLTPETRTTAFVFDTRRVGD